MYQGPDRVALDLVHKVQQILVYAILGSLFLNHISKRKAHPVMSEQFLHCACFSSTFGQSKEDCTTDQTLRLSLCGVMMYLVRKVSFSEKSASIAIYGNNLEKNTQANDKNAVG